MLVFFSILSSFWDKHMSKFSLILHSTLRRDLPFRTKQTTATEYKCILFHNVLCEKALEMLYKFGFF